MLSRLSFFYITNIIFLAITGTPSLFSAIPPCITFENIHPSKYQKTMQLYQEVINPFNTLMQSKRIEELSQGKDIEINIQIGPFLNTLIHTAIFTRHSISAEDGIVDIIKALLVNTTINLTLTNTDGNTPLHTALEEDYFKVANLLLDEMRVRNFDFNTQNKQGNTVLHLAVQKHQHVIVGKLLAISNMAVNTRNKHNKTAQDIAYENGFKPIENLLTEHGGILTHETLSRANSGAQLDGEIFELET
jgi:ankyrin repeat protein